MSGILTRFRPICDRVLVQRLVNEAKTKTGILLPESSVSKALEGTIVAVGPGARDQAGAIIAPVVKVGDHVILPEYGGNKITLEDQEYTLFHERELLGTIEKS